MCRSLAPLALTFAILAGLASCATPAGRVAPDDRPRPSPTAEEVDRLVAEVFARHNDERAKKKLRSVEVSPRLVAAARRHAEDMARRGEMTHKGSDKTMPVDRIREAGYDYYRVGENVAAGRFTVDRLMAGWMDSPPHKRNILGGYSQVGVACAIGGDGKTYWCVTFGLPNRP